MSSITPQELMEAIVALSVFLHCGTDYLLSVPLEELQMIGEAVKAVGEKYRAGHPHSR